VLFRSVPEFYECHVTTLQEKARLLQRAPDRLGVGLLGLESCYFSFESLDAELGLL
jgi:hypothetical protein